MTRRHALSALFLIGFLSTPAACGSLTVEEKNCASFCRSYRSQCGESRQHVDDLCETHCVEEGPAACTECFICLANFQGAPFGCDGPCDFCAPGDAYRLDSSSDCYDLCLPCRP